MPYRDLVRATSRSFLPLGFLARLPYAMAPLGTLVLVSSVTGSYGFAGVAAGAQSLAIGCGGVAVGAVTERLGLRLAGTIAAVLNAFAVVGLIGASHGGRAAMLVASVAVGLTQPQVGPLVRVHWSYLARRDGHGLIHTALAYEAAADELSFVVGPAVVALLVTFQTAPLVTTAVLLVAAAVPFARQYTTSPTPPGRTTTTRQPIPVGRLSAMVTAMALAGAIFGALQVGVTAYAREHHEPALAGLLFAELGIGSAVAGLAYARLTHRFRYLTVSAALVGGMSLIATADVLLPLPVAVLVAGATVAPYMITLYALTERLAPERVATTMTVLTAAGPLGTAAGQALAGQLAARYGPRGGFLLLVVLAAMTAVGVRRSTRP